MENSIASTPKKYYPLSCPYLKGVRERMLTMEQIYHIRNMRKFEGKSLREISRITGHVSTPGYF